MQKSRGQYWMYKCSIIVLLFVGQAHLLKAQWPQQPINDELLSRTVSFQYSGWTYHPRFQLSKNAYHHYRSKSKTQPYEAYVTQSPEYPYLAEWASILDQQVAHLYLSDQQMIEYLTAFVQQGFRYQSDPSNVAHDWPKYPIETVMEGGGDCEDFSALLCALLATFGFHSYLVLVPGHMAVAVEWPYNGQYNYAYDNKKFAYIEATSSNKIGYMPAEYRNARADFLSVRRTAVYARNTTPPIQPQPWQQPVVIAPTPVQPWGAQPAPPTLVPCPRPAPVVPNTPPTLVPCPGPTPVVPPTPPTLVPCPRPAPVVPNTPPTLVPCPSPAPIVPPAPRQVPIYFPTPAPIYYTTYPSQTTVVIQVTTPQTIVPYYGRTTFYRRW
jgi:hypothetical protein